MTEELIPISLRFEEPIEPYASGRRVQESCIFCARNFEVTVYVAAIAKFDFQLTARWVISGRSDAGGIGKGLATHLERSLWSEMAQAGIR